MSTTSTLRYLHKIFDDPSGEIPTIVQANETNVLTETPNVPFYENTVSYSKSNSSHLESFECTFSRAAPGYSLLNRQYKEFHVIYVADGVAYYNGLRMVRGDVVFVEPYFVHSLVYSTEDTPSVYRTLWQGDITVHIAQMLRNYTSDKVYHVGFEESMEGLFKSLIYNRFLGDISMKQFVVGFTDMLLAYLTRAFLPGGADASLADLITRAKNAMDLGYADLTVDQLASLLYVNSKYLSKVFKKYTGMTPKRYITDIKMVHAEHYLISTEYPIQKISEIVGYNNYTNFYIAFKNKYGIAPEEYRKAYSDSDA